jgi:hypothetical protein
VTGVLNALVAIGVVTTGLTASSLDRRTAALLGASGGTIGVYLAWIIAPEAWADSWVLPWLAALGGTVAAIGVWSATRSYAAISSPERVEPDDDTGAVVTAGWSDR